MSGNNFNRRLSATVPHDPPPVNRPRLDEVSRYPYRFDTRYLAWRQVNPDHKQALDKDLTERGRWPRQQAEENCNLIQLYEHIEYYIEEFQTRYGHYKDNTSVLIMPYQFITPEPGWKLIDLDDQLEYEVKAVLTSTDSNGITSFDGRVLLTTIGPDKGHRLRWLDPYGDKDEKCKVIRIRHAEDIRPLIENRKSNGDVANVKGNIFTPIIGYSLVKQEPGSVGNDPFGPAKELKPRRRLTVEDPDNPDLIQNIYGWWMDNLIEFKVYALGGKVADRVSVWLRNFFMLYNSILMQLGVQQMLYWATNRDKEENRSVYDLSVRCIQYYFKTEELSVETNGKLKSYNLDMTFSDFGSMDPWYTSEPTPDLYQTDTSGRNPLYGSPNIGDNN